MILFKVVERHNPQLPDDPKKFYPLVKSTGNIDIRTISDELSDASTLNSVDIRAVIFGLEKTLSEVSSGRLHCEIWRSRNFPHFVERNRGRYRRGSQRS